MRSKIQVLSMPSLLAISLLVCGCGAGVVNTAVEAVPTVDVKSMQGVLYGGHAPIVGAEVFVLQPGVSGYYSKAVDVSLTTKGLATDSNFGYRYVTTGQGGFFSLTGDYTCTPNYPVFLAAYGGNPNTAPPITITGEAISGTTNPYTVKFTFSNTFSAGVLYQGETVTVSGLTGTWAYLNGNQVVLGDANLTNTTFDISTTSNGGNATGSYSVTGSLLQQSANAPNNPGIVNLAVAGLCPASGNFAGTLPFIYMNEVSTVAAGYALAGFQSGQWYNVGIPAPSGDALAFQGIQNAALTAGNLFDITGGNLGTSPAGPDYHVARNTTVNGNGTVPQYLLNTLGNLLANCVDSANTSGTASTQCSKLFGYATSTGAVGGTVPTDIATAIFNIAHNPWANVANLYTLPTGNVPFQPQMSQQPNDFSVGILYTGGGLNGPFYEAVDDTGNVWITNQGSQAGLTISKFSPLGVALSGTGFTGVTDPYGLAIDTTGNVWVANYLAVGSVSKFNSAGTLQATYTGEGMNFPYQPAFDKTGNLWVPNYGQPGFLTTASLSEFNSAGTGVAQYTGGSMARPRVLAINSANSTIFIANQNGGSPLSEFNLTNNTFNTAVSGGGISASTGVALDSAANVWLVNGNNSLTEFNSAGTALSGASGYTGGGLNGSGYLAIDGANKVFTTNGSGNSISEFSNAGVAITGTNGYTAPTNSNGTPLNNPQHIVIDGSGNAWICNFNSSTLVEFVGIGAPVVTPVVSALIAGKYGQKP